MARTIVKLNLSLTLTLSYVNVFLMLNILCLITVTVMAPLTSKVSVPWSSPVQVKGHLILETDEVYIVDFSKEAKRLQFLGDYKQVLVNKSVCGWLP